MAQLPQKLIRVNVNDVIICEAILGPLMKTTLKVQRTNELNNLSWKWKKLSKETYVCL